MKSELEEMHICKFYMQNRLLKMIALYEVNLFGSVHFWFSSTYEAVVSYKCSHIVLPCLQHTGEDAYAAAICVNHMLGG